MFRKFRILDFVVRPIAISPLVTFRVIIGLMLFISTLRFMALGWIEDHYIEPVLHFYYFPFQFLPRLSAFGLYAIHGAMLLASLLVMLGWFYRPAAIILFLTFTFTELIDLTYYLNHYYYVSLVCFLLIWVPANQSFSIDAYRNPRIAKTHVPAWTIGIFMFQITVVYVYAGIAKINTEWLIDAMPLRIWLPPNNHLPVIGEVFNWSYTPWVFSWLGMLFDLTIAFWLFWRPSRPWAYFAVIAFHAMTGILFQIGVFPLVMMAGTLIFFSPEWHNRWQQVFSRLVNLPKIKFDGTHTHAGMHPALKWGLLFYVVFQIVFPWRFLLYPGTLFWTEEGYRFGWRVMLMEKAGTATFFVEDRCTGREGEVLNAEFLNSHQEKQMAMQPDMILQYAHFLKAHYSTKGMCDPKVRAEVYITVNGKPSALYFDPQLDLAQIQDSWAPKTWLYPMPRKEQYAIQ
jgi:hypothetical protein